MAAAALLVVSLKVSGVASTDSLENQVYEITSRVNSSPVPADVQAGHKTLTDAWAAIPPTGGAIGGIILKAPASIAMSVQVGVTAEIDFTIPAAQAALIPVPTGLTSDGLTIKVKHEGTSADDDDEYDYIVFGAAS